MARGKLWTREELCVIRMHYRGGGPSACAPWLPGRSICAIQCCAVKMGCRKYLDDYELGRHTETRALVRAQREWLSAWTPGPDPMIAWSLPR